MKTCVFKTNDKDYTSSVSYTRVTGLHHVVFHRKIKDTNYESKYELFLEDKEFEDLAEFFNTITGNLRSDLK